ncbi:fatty-acyl-CoA synthase [Gordonia hydrophobica]|nr:fatty-acyl-CoA synthase [Gordonia hydrophobica]
MTPSVTTGATDQPLLDMTIGDNFDQTVSQFGAREAIVDVSSARRLTYDQLHLEVDSLAKALINDGVGVGDRVGIWAVNCVEWVVVQFATAKVGAILVSVNPAYREHEVEYVLHQSGIRMLFAHRVFRSSDYAGMLDAVGPRCAQLEHIVYFDDESWDRLLARGRQVADHVVAEVQASLSPNDPINIQYTSGTTGFPKGATLSHRNILNNGFFVGELLGYTPDDRICVPAPFYHCFGMVMGNLGASSHGSCVVIPSPTFDPDLTLRACAEERCTSLYSVPTMFIRMLNVDDFAGYDLTSLRTGVMAGSPCPVEVMKKVTQWVPEVAIAYGMTETSPASLQTRPDDSIDRRVSTLGRAHPHVEITIVDPDSGAVVPRGQSGELCVRGYLVMLGYWNQPEKTAEAIDADGWIHTGDLAAMDDDGYVSITGRIKDVVLRGGENIYPRDRGVPVHPSRHPRRPGDRGSG